MSNLGPRKTVPPKSRPLNPLFSMTMFPLGLTVSGVATGQSYALWTAIASLVMLLAACSWHSIADWRRYNREVDEWNRAHGVTSTVVSTTAKDSRS